jgi:transposase
VDVGSEFLDAAIGPDGPVRRFANNAEGIAGLAAFCAEHRAELAAMEASGGYERKPFALLWAAGIPSAVVDPRAVRHFARSMGRLEKTDRIDCAMVAWYATIKRIAPVPPASEAQRRLTALALRLRQLTELKVQQRNQGRLVEDAAVTATFAAVLTAVEEQIASVEADILASVAADPVWAALDAAFREIKGVGDRTVARLLAELPEIGTLTNKAVSKLAGLAPIADDSGKRQGRRHVRGGREGVRSILFVVARMVCKWVPDFAAFRDRLRAAGKPFKVVCTALAHKLLVRLNAKARDAREALAAATA